MKKQFNYYEVGHIEDSTSLYHSVLRSRGLTEEDVNLLINTPIECVEDWRHLNNIDKGVDLLVEALENDWKIGLLVDPDCDGVTSSAQFYRYLIKCKPDIKITLLHHSGKQHGLSDDIAIPKDIQLLCILDAGSNNIKEEKELVDRGVKVLVIDHHLIEEDWEEVRGVVLINNQQSPKYKNKSISGSGVTYKFLKAMDNKLGANFAEDYIDLAGMGCLGDIMDGTVLDTRYIMNCSVNINMIKNPFMKLLIQEKILKSGKLNLTSLAWNVIPTINSVMRLGTMQERLAVFNAFISDDEQVIKDGLKKANSCKSRQDRQKKKALEMCKQYIESNNLTEYPIIAIDVTDLYDDSGLNGVVANALGSEYNRPIVVVGGRDEIVRGSCRNTNEELIPNFKEWCTNSGLFEANLGHENAHGCIIKKDNLQKIMELGKEQLGTSTEIEKTYAVEKAIDFSKLNKKDVIAIGKLEDLWCTNIKEPIFLVKNVKINSAKVERLGSRNNVLRFKVGDFTFIKMFLSGEFYDRITLKDKKAFGSINLKMDVLCKFKANEWEGNVYPQMEVIDITSEEDSIVDLSDIF